jgi:16S rRNA C967 or C1407 C5-methylase (RsmB/RsmF family)
LGGRPCRSPFVCIIGIRYRWGDCVVREDRAGRAFERTATNTVALPTGRTMCDYRGMSGSTLRTSRNVQKVAAALFEGAADQERFLDALTRGDGKITAVAWLRGDPLPGLFRTGERPEWLPTWIDVAAEGERPGGLEAHHEGQFYCLDLSSAFACATLSEIRTPVSIIVDVCAAPGGKGIVARRYLSPTMVVGNEVIRKRTAQLISNYKRCAVDPALVTSCDPAILGEAIPGSASLVIVDAPCSGQSLVLKDHEAPGAFHPATISMNERRQRRILAHASAVVAPGGYLLYSTCTFSREENEENLCWFLNKFPEFSAISVASLREHQSHLSAVSCYRLWPYQGQGAGAFCALLQKAETSAPGVMLCPENFDQYLHAIWRSPTLFALVPPRSVGREPQDRRQPLTRKGKRGQKGRWRNAQRRSSDDE